MESVISTITILPYTEAEIEYYKLKLKRELTNHHNPKKIKKQLQIARDLFDKVLHDKTLWEGRKKELF
jgi:hypothetical protein